MSNVLDIEKQHQIRALGALGRSLRAIEAATGVRRETISAYLRAAGIPVRRRGGRPRAWPPNPATTGEVSTDLPRSNPATTPRVSTDDVRRRLAWHNTGPSGVTLRHRPWSLLVAIEFADTTAAWRFERYLKTGSGRAFAKRHFRGTAGFQRSHSSLPGHDPSSS